MFKRVLLRMVKSRVDTDPINIAINGFLLILITALVGVLFEVPLLVATLRCISLIVIWVCVAWIWMNNIFLSEYALLRDRRKDP